MFYKNLQAMKASENIRKKDSFSQEEKDKYFTEFKTMSFCDINEGSHGFV
jgi:hypothetical protein